MSCRFYFPGLLIGPAFEFVSYLTLIDETIFTSSQATGANGVNASEKANGSASPGAQRRVPTGRKRVAYRKMATGLAFLGAFVVLGGQYNFSIALQDSFPKRSLLYRYAKPI